MSASSSSSKKPNFSPNAVLEAQAESVPDTVMHTVFQILVERYSPGGEAEVSTREIFNKTGEQKLKGLGRAFEKHGWNVKYDREMGVYVFSDSDKKKKKEVPETK